MVRLNQLKSGDLIELDNKPYRVVFVQFSKLGRGGAILRTKLKSLLDGANIDKTFKGNEQLEEASLTQANAQFLYKQDQEYFFMDSENFEQFSLSKEAIGPKADFLVDGTQVTILSYNEKPVSLELPIKIDLKVIEAEPGVRGDRVSAATKNVTVESGAQIKAPLFVKVGDIIKIDTRDGKYIERVK